jgi:thiamine-phosphate pyrophosphorylase
MLVTDRNATRGRDLVEVCAAAARGGAGLVQVREKDLGDAAVDALLARLREAMPDGTSLLVNDRPDLAVAHGVGLHLPSHRVDAAPQGDLVFGVSVHDEGEIAAALAAGAHYLVAGTVFETASTPGRPGAGLGWIERACALAGEVPVYGIGGITAENAGEVIAAGAHGVAVRGAILGTGDPEGAASKLLAVI